MSGSTFEIPQFQREYSWTSDEVGDFWTDLRNNIDSESYFLGLVILTDDQVRKYVVDGQQRLITLSLLAAAIYFECTRLGRTALAERVQATFLKYLDYETDASTPRIELSDDVDNRTYQDLINTGSASESVEAGSVSEAIIQSYNHLLRSLRIDLKEDPFKRLGKWTEFLTHRLYFAVFVHPNASTAYQVYEVINTRGRDLTTADLLKNYVLYQTRSEERQERYKHWKSISSQFSVEGSNNFVQYIRHAVTVDSGHILPKDLYDFLSDRVEHPGRRPPSPAELMEILDQRLPVYLQMIDPSASGPATPEALAIFSALNSLNVLAVRPMLLAISDLDDALDGMKFVLKLVVRRIVVGNLGTGNVERRFGEAARKIHRQKDWRVIISDLRDLNPSRAEFVEQLRKRSFNKSVLSFMRRSIVMRSVTPDAKGVMHFIWTRPGDYWYGMTEEEGSYWASTIGNTFLARRRFVAADDWDQFKNGILQSGLDGEMTEALSHINEWTPSAVDQIGRGAAEVAADVWYEGE